MRAKSGANVQSLVTFEKNLDIRRMTLMHLLLRQLNTCKDGPTPEGTRGPQRAIVMSIFSRKATLRGSAGANCATDVPLIVDPIKNIYKS